MKNSHRIYKSILLALLIVIVFANCKGNKSDIIADKTSLISKSKVDKIPQRKSNSEANNRQGFDFLETIQSKNVPLKDATNFDYYFKKNKLTESQIKQLSLGKIIQNKDVVNVYLNYRLKLSSSFKTLVISCEIGDSELMTILINYDEHYNLIDSKEIAYDEIAESILRIESDILKNKIICIASDYSNEEPVKIQTVYTILENGKIIN
ncbi:hypothetical protein FNW52_11495 [Flavobacterium sp. ZT3R18]|uniref:hypothetical protein n=1 Tax=Flavobacterium sp. ZT3R18 TaxID=2594429 RepID=UPI00117A757B|nr:hypothetical protein [Flavobacterium sp. ZT3R18]TRX35337.1 hypothetical protein FNW52_11495 [Flavobacterium sp. ZT3R18]